MNRTTACALALTALIAAPSSVAADPDIEKGKKVYDGIGACSGCHGPSGAGDGPAAAGLTPKPRNLAKGDYSIDTDGDGKKGTATDLFNIISNGAAKYGGSVLMAGRPDIPEADRKSLVKYIQSLAK